MKFHSKKILILMILCNIAAVFGYYLLFRHIEVQSQTASSLTNTLDVSQQKNSHLGSLRSVIKDTEDQRQQLSGLLLSGDAEISFIEQMEALAKNSGLAVDVNSVSSVAGDSPTVKRFQMQLGTTGSWSNTLYFLSQVENLPYDVHVQGVSLNKQSASDRGVSSAWIATFDIGVTEKI